MSTTSGNMKTFKVTDQHGNQYIMIPVDTEARQAIDEAKNLQFDENHFKAEESQDGKDVNISLNEIGLEVDTTTPLQAQVTNDAVKLGVDSVFSSAVAQPFVTSSSKSYETDENVTYKGRIYKSKVNQTAPVTWDASKWEEISILPLKNYDPDDVAEVVETVKKLETDLDTQITSNFDMPNISQVYDFANPSNWMTQNGACMLYQAFNIPINHEIRTETDDPDTPTLLGVYAQQSFAHKIMLALYEYEYPEDGEYPGSSTYVCDTGPITITGGLNEFPIKNKNPSISELRSDRTYYAALYLPSTAFVNGLYLAGCPNYGNASVPAEPRLSCATENITFDGSELDLSDPTTTLNHYQTIQIPGQPVYYQYYIGPWVGGYNERWSTPRFYMQIRNGAYATPVIPTVPFNTLGDSTIPRGGIRASDLPGFTCSENNSAFRDIAPLINVTITAIEWIDSLSTAPGWVAGNCVYSSDYSTNMSGESNTVTDLGQVVQTSNGTGYAHRITFSTPIQLSANTTYRILCSSFSSSNDWIWSWTDPVDVFDACNNGWWVDWTSNISRYAYNAGQYNKIYDSNNNHYVV